MVKPKINLYFYCKLITVEYLEKKIQYVTGQPTIILTLCDERSQPCYHDACFFVSIPLQVQGYVR